MSLTSKTVMSTKAVADLVASSLSVAYECVEGSELMCVCVCVRGRWGRRGRWRWREIGGRSSGEKLECYILQHANRHHTLQWLDNDTGSDPAVLQDIHKHMYHDCEGVC